MGLSDCCPLLKEIYYTLPSYTLYYASLKTNYFAKLLPLFSRVECFRIALLNGYLLLLVLGIAFVMYIGKHS